MEGAPIFTSGSAVSATRLSVEILQLTKKYHLKTIVWHYLQTDGQTDGQTHDDGIYRA